MLQSLTSGFAGLLFMKKVVLPIFIFLFAVACQTSNGGSVPIVQTVEVTRQVVVTEYATVQVPVEVTRQVFIEVEAEVTPRPTRVPEFAAGSAENPIRLIFSPIYGQTVTEIRAENIALALTRETGLEVDVVLAEDYAQTLAAVCQTPDTTVAILTSLEYVLAERQCGLEIGYAGLRDGITWISSMIMVRDEEITTIEDLTDLTWGVSATEDLTNYLWFQALFDAEGIATGDVTTYGTDASTVIAGFNGEVDFVTATYLPPILPYDEVQWRFGEDDPELWRRTSQQPRRSGIGFVVVLGYVEDGGYRVRDARAIALDSEPDIFAETDILRLSDQMPNDALAFSPEMPLALSRQIGQTLETYALSEDCNMGLCSADFFNWEGIAPVRDEFYDSVRFVIEQLELTEADVFTYLNE